MRTEKSKVYVSIMDIAPKQVENTKDLCICDGCGKAFEPSETLMEKCNNLSFQGILGIKGITKGRKTYYMVSPCCKKITSVRI